MHRPRLTVAVDPLGEHAGTAAAVAEEPQFAAVRGPRRAPAVSVEGEPTHVGFGHVEDPNRVVRPGAGYGDPFSVRRHDEFAEEGVPLVIGRFDLVVTIDPDEFLLRFGCPAAFRSRERSDWP